MSTNESLPPHINEPAAEFCEGSGSVYALIGEIIQASGSGVEGHFLLVGQDLTRPIEDEILPLFEYFLKPRSAQQARDWLDWAGASPDFLDELVDLGFLVRVDRHSASTAAESLKGLILRPQSVPGGMSEDGYTELLPPGATEPTMFVSPELAGALWENDAALDVPAVIAKLASLSGEDTETTAQRVLTAVPMLLEYGWARLEWLQVPNVS